MRLSSLRFALLTALLWGAVFSVSAQVDNRFVLVGSLSDQVVVDDSTYTVSVSYETDQTGNSYLANQVEVGWRIVTSSKRMYRISAINSASFFSANFTVVELPGTNGSPTGISETYQYDGTTERIPIAPQNASGISAAFAAILHTHNVENGGGSGGGGDPPSYGLYVDDTEAALNGVAIGQQYRADVGNTRGAPLGSIVTRIE